ncbi:MAG: cation:proton antiporter [Candidatus Marsarchaeota archaeon]|nr:cation:proton antiporter [Candidatus Marsarchaeota archaeon]
MITVTIIAISVILAASIIVGELFEKFGIPSVAGSLLSGLALGPAVFNVVAPSDQLSGISSMSLFFIILLIGLQMRTEMLRKFLSAGIMLAFSSFLAPFLVVFFSIFFLFQFPLTISLIVSLAISVPSISIVSVFVTKAGLIKRKTGYTILASTVISDIAAFIVLAFISRDISSAIDVVYYFILLMLILVVVNALLNYRPSALRKYLTKISRTLKTGYMSIAAFILWGLLIATIFESIGISYVIGAFFAGLLTHEELIGHRTHGKLERTFQRMNGAFFIPIFFGIAGVNATLLGWSAYLFIALLGVAILSFVVSYSLTHYLTGLKVRMVSLTQGQTASILSGRGAVGIAIAIIALNLGIIPNIAYSFIVISTIVISVMASISLMKVNTQRKSKHK